MLSLEVDGSGLTELRQQAEHALRGQPVNITTLTPVEVTRLIEELQVHQIELELQNAQLRQTQQELEVARDRYTHLYDFAPVGYLTLDEHGVIQSANLTSVGMLGVAERLVLDRTPFSDFVAREDQDVFFKFWRKIRRTDTPQQCEVRLARKDGSTFFAHLEGMIVTTNHETAASCRLIISDINRRKQAEEAMYRTQKLESLGVMAGGIAHGFNNLLSAMLMQYELAQFKLPLDHAARVHIQKASLAARHAVNLTKQLLAYVGQGESQMASLQLNEVIAESMVLLEASIPQTILLVTNLMPGMALIEADRGQMQQVIINLLMNAAEAYENKPGMVWVETRMVVLSEKQIQAFTADYEVLPGAYVLLVVRDEGQGMTPDAVARAFDPFFTTKFTGRGLGLAAVRGIVRQHRGGIQVESLWQKGTTFRVYLPVALPTNDVAATMAAADTEVTAVVLLIDDEAALRDGLQELLELNRMRVLAADNGGDGLELFRRHQQEIDLVVLDLTMPIMSGEEVLAELRRIRADVPVVVTTGYGEVEALRRLKGMEPFYFLSKPFVVEDLLTKIAEIGEAR